MLPYKCRISLIVVTVQRNPALFGAAGHHMASGWSMSVSKGAGCVYTHPPLGVSSAL